MEVAEYDFGYAKVRIHPGNLSAEDGRAVLEEATALFIRKAENRHPGYWRRRRQEGGLNDGKRIFDGCGR